ncbi:putative RNA polymerase II subunit B1 CTD phosphatase RPAP2 [Paramyrothecium foliicola]|nr:putative RNA polymerase II subunit B1 CTD phosphatase RPAP2 [Paramyrothecium foliicola]
MAMASKQQPTKGILKNRPSAQAGSDLVTDPKEVAIQHARILQHRKELETQILEDLIILSEFPAERSPACTAANPASSDVSGFKKHVRLFQPSDYDDLIEERNVNGLCGYTLCARPRRDAGPGGEWKITRSGDIVRRKDFEMWCSQQCARRALYVKVQLNETAAWERAGIPDIEIDLLEENKPQVSEEDAVAKKLENLKLEDKRQAARDSAALALERGDRNPQPNKIKVTLREKNTSAPGPVEDMADAGDDHLRVEGYRSKTGQDTKGS